jgi:hypothetical protein
VGLKKRGEREKGEEDKKPGTSFICGFSGEAQGNNSTLDFG